MADSSFQNEVPKARVNIQPDLHTGSAQKKVELPLKLLAVGNFSNGKETLPLSERSKLTISKHNFNSVLSELNPEISIDVANPLRGYGRQSVAGISDAESKSIRQAQR